MSGLNIYAVQQDVLAHAKAVMPNYRVESGGIPDAETVQYTDGTLSPYIILNFADLLPTARDKSFGGARYDGYYSYVNIFAIAPQEPIAREVVNSVRNQMLGYVPANASELSIASGGGVFALPTGRDLPTSYAALASLRFETNVSDVASS